METLIGSNIRIPIMEKNDDDSGHDSIDKKSESDKKSIKVIRK